MQRTLIKNLSEHIGKEVSISGWVSVRRDHGKLIFIDLRDSTGTIQMVILPSHSEAHSLANTVRSEWVLRVIGLVNKRPEKMVNADVVNGEIELEVTGIEVLNESETPPFDLLTDGMEVNEEVRLKYRYLDLRRERMHRNLNMRHSTIKHVRDYLSSEGFIEVETPILTKSTPEGARDYVVPSRIDQGKFYALPQAPQQYKQLLMTAGIPKYFQIAKCMRDEDTRGDRQPEFTQLDLEMSFVEQEDVMRLNENLMISIVEKLYPNKKIQQKPFPIMTYASAMSKYGIDRPDLREDKNDPNLLAFCWVIDFPFFEKNKEGGWTFTHNPFSAPKPEFMDLLMKGADVGEILTAQYDLVLNGMEVGGGSLRNHKPDALLKVLNTIGYTKETAEKNFGHMLNAFRQGTPPHGGIAWGLDRLISILLDEPNIREVIAFPKTGEGRDLMMDAPSEIDEKQLKELGIKISKVGIIEK